MIGVVSSIMGVLGVSLRDLWEPDDALPGAPTYAGGWGPDRTMYRLHEDEIPTHPAFNAFSDNAVFGDERNFVGMRLPTDVVNGDNVWSDRLEVEPGDTVIVRAFYENAAPDNYDSIPTSWLQGATARFYVPAEASEDVSVGVTLSASNAASVWDGATALASEPVRLVPITGSGIIETNAPGLDFDAVSAATGAPFHLGFETNDGVIKPGFEYAGYIVMQFRVEPG
ncbi:hypothetical protein L332_02460 [Agrococcus pavilionensis RW1]|uniref:Uncharacterized protein n=1 Tax=Agrococcus pavilionensis RW1 TaxID=1330458 RepID=U1MRP0_9MICO|nr:hypothetical protein L332_02460 [Agrococcus pavilionensis RW1]